MNLRPTAAFAAAAVLLAACGYAPARAAASATHPAPFIHADEPVGAGVPAPTPTPWPHVGVVIKIPQMGISLSIVEGHGLEPDLGLADHYPGTMWPGEAGRSFIYAHAQDPPRGMPVMFGPLLYAARTNTAVGKQVLIDEPDGRVLHYTITRSTDQWPVTDSSLLGQPGHEEVVLYTCTSWTYSDPKVVAWAEPDPQFVTTT
jgi:LPXTG-site transpeptidase (sortase) family protein